MKLNKFLILSLIYCNNLFCIEVQYFISPYFFKNPHSYSVNGLQSYKYNPGKLLNEALSSESNVFKKCIEGEKSDYVVNLFPSTFYNPPLHTLTTDLKVRIYDSNGKNTENLLINYSSRVMLHENSDKLIISHFKKLTDLLSKQLFLLKTNKNMIDGGICKIFI